MTNSSGAALLNLLNGGVSSSSTNKPTDDGKHLLALLKGGGCSKTAWEQASATTTSSSSESTMSPILDKLFNNTTHEDEHDCSYKRFLCWYWEHDLPCVHGDSCRFAHGFGDMGPSQVDGALVTIDGSDFPARTMIKFPLPGCDVRYQSGVFSKEESELFLSMLISEKYVSWNRVGYGRDVVQFSSPKGMKYSFSDEDYIADAFPPFVLGIMHRVKSIIEPIYGEDKVQFNYCVANVYRSGKAGVTYHSDNEPELRPDCPIACVSFGAERIFSLKAMGAKSETAYHVRLEDGSVVIMAGDTQKNYLHQITKEDHISSHYPRVSLTFRPKGRVMMTKVTGPREDNAADGGGSSSPPGKGKGNNREGKTAERKEDLMVNKESTPPPGKGNRRGGGKGRKGNDYDNNSSKPRGGKGVNDGSRSKSSTPEKVKEQAAEDQGPPGSSRKVVIRLLPPSITEEQLWKAIPEAVKESVVGRYFVGGSQPKRPSITCPAVNSRCYLEFETKQKAFDFVNAFHGHKFVDHSGETYRAVVCASPWGRCLPSSSGRRSRHNRDIKEGSIDKCKYFKDFISSIKEESQVAALPEPTEVTCDPGKTPLVDYINEWYKDKERKKEKERRRQREAAEEARKKKKQTTEKEGGKNGESGKDGKRKKGGHHHHNGGGGGSKDDEMVDEEEWRVRMRAMLEANAEFGVGEIGIDKIKAKEVPMDVQMKVFKTQLMMASDLHRPVSIHCVHGYGHLLNVFKDEEAYEGIPAVVLHAYGGSAELIKDFIKCTKRRAYFSISARSPTPKNLVAVVHAVPRDRLLIETDAPDQMPYDDMLSGASLDPVAVGINDSGLIDVVLKRVSEALREKEDVIAAITSENAQRAFGTV
ncbi:hypothetical protein FOL47_000397 [Perkinsus chesapeaki]|uniref:Uncharacterized protein n=1 Tax=Perkinsus chesapeaki TaxID=330153 RepID=A0A7J6MLW1_PERCH|nr:hypothetical protein FOL47_000397 [Perkinsus chesapeaki]